MLYQQQGKKNQGTGKLHSDHNLAPIPPIHENPRHRPEKDMGNCLHHKHNPRGQGGTGNLIDVKRQGGVKNHIAQNGNKLAYPEKPKFAVSEYAEHSDLINYKEAFTFKMIFCFYLLKPVSIIIEAGDPREKMD